MIYRYKNTALRSVPIIDYKSLNNSYSCGLFLFIRKHNQVFAMFYRNAPWGLDVKIKSTTTYNIFDVVRIFKKLFPETHPALSTWTETYMIIRNNILPGKYVLQNL